MWEGGRCPWDRGSGCVGRSLVVTKQARIAVARRAVEAKPKPPRERRPRPVRPPRQNERAPRPERVVPVVYGPPVPGRCRPNRHWKDYKGRCRECAREALARVRGPKPLGRCVYCMKTFETDQPRRRKYCSDRCRGRFERESKAAA